MSIHIDKLFIRPCCTLWVNGPCRAVPPVAAVLVTLVAAIANAAVPTNGIGEPMLHAPALPVIHVRISYNPALTKLWQAALRQNRPEVISRTCSAIRAATSRHDPYLHSLIAPLEHLAVTQTVPLTVRISVVSALAAIGDRSTESLLAHLAASNHAAFALELDPLLARWKSADMPPVWLRQLRPGAATLQLQFDAAQAVGIARVRSADGILKTIVLNGRNPLSLRMAAAQSLSMLRPTGLAALATDLLKAQGNGLAQRLIACKTVSGAGSVSQRRILRRLAADANSAVAAIAWRTLLTHDVNALRPLTAKMSANADPTIRLLVARTWRHIGGTTSINGLAQLLGDPRRPIRWYARAALIQLGSESQSRSAVLRACRSVIRGTQPLAIHQASLVLGALHDKASAQDFLALLNNDSPTVRLGAVVALRRVAVPRTMPELLAFAKTTAQNSQYAFAHLSKAAYVPQFNADNLQLSQAFQCFGLMHYRPALALMIACIPKHAPYGLQAREAAIWAIGIIDNGQSHPHLARELAQRLDDMALPMPEFEQVRMMSAITLGRINGRAQLVDLKASFAADDIGNISLACRWAIGRLTGKMPPLPHASEMFQTGFLIPLGR